MAFFTKPLTFALCKKLAEKRLSEAKILLVNKESSGAYYLAGYSIELALKAIYCKGVGKYNFPPERNIYNKLYDHDLNGLLNVSGIKSEYDKEVKTNVPLLSSWNVVKDWSEKTRYNVIKRSDAASLIDSVEVVLKWIKTLW